MAIHIIDKKPDIFLTRAEHDRLWQEYQQFIMFHAWPPSFEDYVRMRRQQGAEGQEYISTGSPPPITYTTTCSRLPTR